MAPESRSDRLERKYAKVKKRLLELGPVLQGSILSRTLRREAPANTGRMKDYGPYYQWTRKRKGKTVIQNLSESQAKAYGKAIRENRKLQKLLAEMREISLEILESTTEGVARRARGKGR